jgi:glutaredoxin
MSDVSGLAKVLSNRFGARRVAKYLRVFSSVPLVAVFALSSGCSRRQSSAPELVVRDDTTGMLFSWIDAQAEVHVERSARDVPFLGRDLVRVVAMGAVEDAVFLADLRNPRADGSYPVKASTAREFDGVLASRRREAAARPSAKASADARSAGPSNGPALPSADVVIYGASWCGACHEAAAYLKHKGIAFVEKDIEREPRAQEEMAAKLKGAGLPRGSIPVLDVRGHILVGFSEDAVEQALRN